MSTDRMIGGRRHLILDDGTAVDIDARPPAGYVPTEPYPAGDALLPCRVCREPLAAVLARRGAHLLCLPDEQAHALLRICGAGRTWHTLIPVYHGERPTKRAPREIRHPAPNRTRVGGVAA